MSYLYPKNSITSDEIDQFLDVYHQKETVFVEKVIQRKNIFIVFDKKYCIGSSNLGN